MQLLTYVVSISLSHNHENRPCQSCIQYMLNARAIFTSLVPKALHDGGLWFGNETACTHAYKIRGLENA